MASGGSLSDPEAGSVVENKAVGSLFTDVIINQVTNLFVRLLSDLQTYLLTYILADLEHNVNVMRSNCVSLIRKTVC